MKILINLVVALAASVGVSETLFNGKNLDGWVGDPQYWSVKDGAITGSSTEKIPRTSYLYWKGAPVADFELRFKYKMIGGNSGVQYRSRVSNEKTWQVVGYQADIDATGGVTGILYEQGGRGICAMRSQKVTMLPGEKKGVMKITGKTGDANALHRSLKLEQWNDYLIVAKGNHLKHVINGKTFVDVLDEDPARRKMEGILALQIHAGGPMKVQYKDFQLTRLDAVVAKADTTAGLKAMDGFAVDEVYQVPKDTMGSLVAMTFDDKGRLYTNNEGKPGLYRFTFDASGAIEKIDTVHKGIGRAQGLCWAHNSLYAVVGYDLPDFKAGIHRLQDTTGDGQFDTVTTIYTLQGRGGHGPHALVLGPDDKLYLAAGNHTNLLPSDHSLVPRVWDEDLLLPRMWDARGHAKGKLAPGGYIVRMNSDGGNTTLISMGYRNQYDLAFNEVGDLFTYDADMEWDLGTPWYRPTRINHVVSGSDFGWRAGTGKWPDYYPDSFGSVLDIGQGSPTGVIFGYGAKFPEKYQRALYIADWSWGKLYACHLTPDGSSYAATKEPLVTGTPMPITDLAVSPKDGHIYFTTGGRNADSYIYRVRYVGGEQTSKAQSRTQINELGKLRRSLEAYHGKQDVAAVAAAWPHLGHADRGVRHAARTALEHQPANAWRDRLKSEANPQVVIAAAIALARVGKASDRPLNLNALNRLKSITLNEQGQLDLCRAYALTFIRLGPLTDAERAQALQKIDLFPRGLARVDRELSQLAVYLEADWAVARTVGLMTNGETSNQDQIQYALNLRTMKKGWTLDLQKAYFEWFNRASAFGGGMSFKGFIKNVKNEAIKTQGAKAIPALAEALKDKKVENPFAGLVPPKGPGKAWTIAELAESASRKMSKRNFANGRKMYIAGMCMTCHTFGGSGGAIGPDLTGVGGRFSARDLLEAIIEPSKVISDQYETTVFSTKDGQKITGKIVNVGKNNLINISVNPYDPSQLVKIPLGDITSRVASPVSEMPPGLINGMNEDEVMDLLAYLISRGDKNHALFK